MSTIAAQLTELVATAAAAAGHADSPVPLEPCVATADPRHGDYQSNYAFRLGKSMRTNPRAVAEGVRDAMPAHDLVDGVDVAGPGFLNFRLSAAGLAADVTRRAASDRLGAPLPGEGKTMVIDYSSPNIAKRMHVGHLRSTVIGNALHRLHAFLGWRVVSDNHIGDWGTQYGKLIVGWHGWRDQAAYDADPIGELQRVYQEFGKRSEDDDTLIEAARAETVKLQQGDAENRALWRRFVDVSMAEFDGVYARFGIEFDVTYGESHYRDALDGLVDRLLEAELIEHDEGAVIARFPADSGLGKTVLMIRKSDGAALYGTTDLATLELREREWQPDLVAYVTDNRQQLHFRQVFNLARRAGIVREQTELKHIYFGILKLADGGIVATRSQKKDTNVDLVHVLDTAVQHARAVVDAKSGHLPEAERADIAEALGVGAVRYFDLSQNPQSDIVFDWDRMLADTGNTATYLMYANARCNSILRKAVEQGLTAGAIRIEHDAERELALAIARLPEAIEQAAGSWRPNALCDQLFRLAQSLAGFYTQCRVLDAGDSDTVASRLALVQATAHALSVGMRIVGLTPLERM